jgi:anti-anti-sigma factor
MTKQTTWHTGAVELNHFGDDLLSLASSVRNQVVRLDCSAVHSLNSLGVSNLVALNNKLAGDLTLVNVDPHLHQLLRLTGLDTILDVRY